MDNDVMRQIIRDAMDVQTIGRMMTNPKNKLADYVVLRKRLQLQGEHLEYLIEQQIIADAIE